MGDEKQLRRDIDKLYDTVYDNIKLSEDNEKSIKDLLQRLALNQGSSDKFNYAVIKKLQDDLEYQEFWILANAYYDYKVNRFVKINMDSNSFGIQIQAEGTYPNEQELGYLDNTSIGVWRNPPTSYVYKDTTTYDYHDYDTLHHIGAKLRSNDRWIEYGISSGWNNSLMLDAFGGITIGGAGFEVDGNGIFPYTRLTSSKYTVNNTNYYLLGLLDNAYHSLSGCDNNNTYSWFVGLRIPEAGYNTKDNANASFVVMYNDTAYNSSNIHQLDNTKWHIVFQINKDGVV